MHVLFVAMIMALVGCDTLPTHPHDEVHGMHLAIIEEHRPLGVVNRLRKVIYPIVSDYRHCLNDQEREGCPGKADDE